MNAISVYRTPLVTTAARGDGLCSCGQLSHGAAVVTKGVRYTLIAFIDEEQEVEEDDEDEDEV